MTAMFILQLSLSAAQIGIQLFMQWSGPATTNVLLYCQHMACVKMPMHAFTQTVACEVVSFAYLTRVDD